MSQLIVPLNEPVIIQNVVSGRLLDADLGSINADGTKVQLYGRDATNQKQRQWQIISAGGGKFNIVNIQSGRFLDADTGTIQNDGTKVQLYGSVVPAAQNRQWILNSASVGVDRLYVMNAQSLRLLDADAATLGSDGTEVQLYGFSDEMMPNRQWRIVRLKEYEDSNRAPHSFQDAPTTFDLLIVAPYVFGGLFGSYQTSKRQVGIESHLITLTATEGSGGILDDFSGNDHPERIKNAIEYAYRVHHAKYVMLVGDASLIPARWRFIKEPPPSDPTQGAWAGWHDGTYQPSELYYSSLYHHGAKGVILPSDQQGTLIATGLNGQFDTWDYNGDNKYNEQEWAHDVLVYNQDYVDGLPDLAVARVPARTTSEVEAFLQKVVTYESSSQVNVSNSKVFGFIADGNYPGADQDCEQVKQSVSLQNSSMSALYNLQPGQELLPNWTQAQNSTLANFANECWWLAYVGHGSSQGWDFAVASYQQIAQLNNGPNYPIVFSASCETGQFLGNPPFGPYQDIAGNFHWFWYDTSAAPDKQIAERDASNNVIDYLLKPITVPTPSPYDLVNGTTDRTLACAWLFNANGGAIAYFGEVLVCEDDKGRDIAADLVSSLNSLLSSARTLGDVWLTAQRKYWNDNYMNETDTFRHPRIYLGIMTFFGDPSLRFQHP